MEFATLPDLDLHSFGIEWPMPLGDLARPTFLDDAIDLAPPPGIEISKHARLPISVVDADRLVGAARVAIAPPGMTCVFNPSGQVFDASGLACVFDDDGVAATPVKGGRVS